MKVMYVGSKSDEGASLNLEREITELQRRFGESSGEPVSFLFLPRLLAEELPLEIAKARPDVLHISAHGTAQNLALADESGREVPLSADALNAYLPVDKLPRLIYLNACDSNLIAEKLGDTVPMVIGTTAPITNRAARAGASAFYGRILEGASVGHAFRVAQKTIETLQSGNASAAIYCRKEIDPEKEYLHRSPRIIADFFEGKPKASRDGRYSIRVGVSGCPANAIQIVVFTDDASFIDDSDDGELASDLCYVIRGTPIKGVRWIGEFETWDVSGDFRVFAVGVLGDGSTFTIPATDVCDAIESKYRISSKGVVPPEVAKAVVALRRNDGAQLD